MKKHLSSLYTLAASPKAADASFGEDSRAAAPMRPPSTPRRACTGKASMPLALVISEIMQEHIFAVQSQLNDTSK